MCGDEEHNHFHQQQLFSATCVIFYCLVICISYVSTDVHLAPPLTTKFWNNRGWHLTLHSHYSKEFFFYKYFNCLCLSGHLDLVTLHCTALHDVAKLSQIERAPLNFYIPKSIPIALRTRKIYNFRRQPENLKLKTTPQTWRRTQKKDTPNIEDNLKNVEDPEN